MILLIFICLVINLCAMTVSVRSRMLYGGQIFSITFNALLAVLNAVFLWNLIEGLA